jgi:hypothetical protein
MSDECHSEWAKYKYLRPIDFPRTFDVLDTTLDVIGAKSEVGDNLLFATILIFPIMVCWSWNAFGALGNHLQLDLSKILAMCHCDMIQSDSSVVVI